MANDAILALLNQPAVQAVLVKTAGDAIQGYLKSLDKSHAVDAYKTYLQMGVMVFTALATYLTLALNHNLGSVDPKAMIEFALLYYNAHFVSQGVQAVAKK